MEEHCKIKAVNEKSYEIELLIENEHTNEDTLFDESLNPSSEDLRIIESIGREEYTHTLDKELARESDGVIMATMAHYCLPDDDDPDNLFHYPQTPGKIIFWKSIYDVDHEVPCRLSFHIFYRDIMGNLRKLNRDAINIDTTLKAGDTNDTWIKVFISNADKNPLDCGRYYLVQQCQKSDGTPIGDLYPIYLNIVPPTGPFEYSQSNLVGMENVYKQMTILLKQKRFNDQRLAMNLSPATINLHAAVMGNKGDGKTSFAHVLYDFYKKNHLIADGDLHIIDATKWLSYSEDTSKIDSDIEEAKNGMLYIENAAEMIPLDTRGNREYAVQALVRHLRTNTHNVAVVLADTPENLSALLSTDDLRHHIGQIYHLPTLSLDQMVEVAEKECVSRNFLLTDEAKVALKAYLNMQPDITSKDILRLVDTMIMNMSIRVVNSSKQLFESPNLLSELHAEDVPQIKVNHYEQSINKLNKLVGLKNLKHNIERHLNLVRFAQLRHQNGLSAVMPPLHMIFTGNPGTGKTTVAKMLGEIYASLGILKTGKVVFVDRKKLVGRFIGDTEDNTKRALQQAHGNILFVDEAYTLVGDPDDKKDFGPKVLDCLLDELSKENTDMIIIMAGYPDEMETMLKSNKGLQSRFPYTFQFEDYSEDELLEIAVRTAQENGYSFSNEAIQRLSGLIHREVERSAIRDQKHFGNARFITRLISTQIIPNMSRRVLASNEIDNSQKLLSHIEAVDIPTSIQQTDYLIDEALISRALNRLDAMVGLKEVKRTLHDLVTLARSRQKNGTDISELISLQWTFTGGTGTGKSSVARILAQLLHAMHLINSERMTQLRMPQTQSNSWTPHEIDTLLRDTIKRSEQGLLFIDLDDVANNYIDLQWLRCKLTSLTAELPGSYAFVIAVDDRHLTEQPIEMPLSTSVIHFSDYTAEELMEILQQRLYKHSFTLTEEATKNVAEHIRNLCNKRSCGFANARTIRHIYTAITGAAEVRMMQAGTVVTPIEIQKNDVESFTWKPINSNRIGFEN